MLFINSYNNIDSRFSFSFQTSNLTCTNGTLFISLSELLPVWVIRFTVLDCRRVCNSICLSPNVATA